MGYPNGLRLICMKNWLFLNNCPRNVCKQNFVRTTGRQNRSYEMKSLVITSVVIALMAGSSSAQAPSSQTPAAQNQPTQNQTESNRTTSGGGQAQNQSIRQQVQRNLQQAGYTDISIMPESFLVGAKDKDGNPVMMVINPDSVTAITEINRENGSATTGSANAGSQRRTVPGQTDSTKRQ
jgi:hypothetical protein